MSQLIQKTNAFIQIAEQYDILNDVMSFGLHRYWKSLLVKKIARQKTGPVKALDIASGTGDMAKLFLKSSLTVDRMVGVDPSIPMLRVAKQKVPKAEFYISKGEKLNFKDEHFDIITCTFGPRNMDDLEKAAKEWRRVLRPGGLVGILESHPLDERLGSGVFKAHWKFVVPLLGRIIGKPEAYRYLVESTQNFLKQNDLIALFQKKGFEKIEGKSLLPYGQIGLTLLRRV